MSATLARFAIALLLASLSAVSIAGPHRALPLVAANDNRLAAGTLRSDTLFVDLDIRMARWYPEAQDGPFVDVPVLGEVGRAPQIPGPLLRVRVGTVIVAHLTNALADSTITWYGLSTKPSLDSVRVRPGETVVARFVAGDAGTYLYGARVGALNWDQREREQLGGAFIVDARGARTDDRVFVINIWSEPIDSVNGLNALAINGRSWPFTERISATRGDTLRWRIVNGSVRPHPMHLHGFYYRIRSLGDLTRDTAYARGRRPNLVTQVMQPFSTMAMEWVAEREGNWLFHCHLSFHVVADARLAPGADHADHMSGDATRHMAGLVMGIQVKPGRRPERIVRTRPRALRLIAQEGHRRGRAPRALGLVLQRGAPPSADSTEVPGAALILTRGQPTDITVVNHLNEATAIHWHGIELESWSDGVAGWSGAPGRVAKAIAPGDSFTAHLTLPRAGTFIYHTHLNDIEQLTSGMYGAIVVLEPGQRYDPETDHLFVVGWDGAYGPVHFVVNGDSLPAPRVFKAGVHHRLRFVFIGPAEGGTFTLRSASGPVQWRTLAQDGAEIPRARQADVPAVITGWAGQTFDFDFHPQAPGDYTLIAGDPAKPSWSGRVLVR